MVTTLEEAQAALIGEYGGPCSADDYIDCTHGIVFIPSQYGKSGRVEHLTASRMGLADVVNYIRRVHNSSSDRHVANELERILEELERECPHLSAVWK